MLTHRSLPSPAEHCAASARAALHASARRCTRPGARLVVGELADRHHVPLATLVRLADDAGLHPVRRTGLPLAYYAMFKPCTRTANPC